MRGARGGGRMVLQTHKKPTPSKWDDAQKWLVGLSGGGQCNYSGSTTKGRNSNADDRRLLNSASQMERERSSCSSADGMAGAGLGLHDEGETKKIVECGYDESTGKRPVCVRDMGTDMSPIASQDPSRDATPVRVKLSSRTPSMISRPVPSRSSTPRMLQVLHGGSSHEMQQPGGGRSEMCVSVEIGKDGNSWSSSSRVAGEVTEKSEKANPANSLESQASAWDQAERAKYMARYKREEMKIQAWENHLMRKAETEMRKSEAKAERLKVRAEERMAKKVAAARRIAEERCASAEAELNSQAERTSEDADYIRRTGRLPSSFFSMFRFFSFCGG